MPPEVVTILVDVEKACRLIKEFIGDKSVVDFRDNLQLRSAVERQFITIGEALQQGLRIWPELADFITESRRIVNFRNVMVHGYARIAVDTVWGVVETDLNLLHQQVNQLLQDKTEP
jgi:uncharacterized protein with HEPN domain